MLVRPRRDAGVRHGHVDAGGHLVPDERPAFDGSRAVPDAAAQRRHWELAVEDVRECVEGTFLEGAPIVGVSSVTLEGIEPLKEALRALPDPKRETEGAFRLPSWDAV